MTTSKCNCIRWAFDLSQWRPTLAELTLATACLQSEEKLRLMKFHFRDDFDASLIGRLLMRKFVRNATHLEYEQIRFGRDSRGKPFLINTIRPGQHVDFNVSHQGNYSVLAGCVQETTMDNVPPVRIGVDVMKIEYSGGKSLGEFFRVMTRTFSVDEWRFIRSRATETHQLTAFMRLWCLKESYVKNVGVGITTNLQKISFKLKTDEVCRGAVVRDSRVEVDGNLLTNFTFEEHLLDEEHGVALAFECEPENLVRGCFRILKFEELIEDAVPLLEPDLSYSENVLRKEYKHGAA